MTSIMHGNTRMRKGKILGEGKKRLKMKKKKGEKRVDPH